MKIQNMVFIRGLVKLSSTLSAVLFIREDSSSTVATRANIITLENGSPIKPE